MQHIFCGLRKKIYFFFVAHGGSLVPFRGILYNGFAHNEHITR